MDIQRYWLDVLRQDAGAIRGWFHPDAWVNWHNTNEHFTLEEFIRANCEYPGRWEGRIEQFAESGGLAVTALRVWSKDEALSFHVTSFFRLRDGKIASIDEYWGDDGPPPQWRRALNLGTSIE